MMTKTTARLLEDIEDIFTKRLKPAEPRAWFNNWRSADEIPDKSDLKLPSVRTSGLELVFTYIKSLCKSREMLEEAMVSNTKGDHRYNKIRASIQEIDSKVREMFSQILGLDFNEHYSLSDEDLEQSMSSEELAKMLKP